MRWKYNPVWSGSFSQPCHSGMADSASSTHLHGVDGLRMHPYGHTLLLKVIKHLIYIRCKCNPIWSGPWPQLCHSGMVCTQLLPWFSQLNPPPRLWWTRDTSIQQFTALEGSYTFCIHARWKCNPVWSGSWHHHVIVVGLIQPAQPTYMGLMD